MINYRLQELGKINLEVFKIHEPPLAGSKANASNLSVAPRWWMLSGSGGSALQARYSDYHTTKLVIAGTCRFELYPPKSVRYLYPFPSIHAANSQSQVNMYDSLVNATFPLFKKADQFSVILNSGDVLYVPPYWHVHTEELSWNGVSFGVDVLSVSAVQTLLMEAYSTSLPLRGDKDFKLEKKEHKIIASMMFIVHLLSRVVGIESPRKFAQSMYSTRYSQLYPENSLYLLQHKGFVCYQNQPELIEHVLNR